MLLLKMFRELATQAWLGTICRRSNFDVEKVCFKIFDIMLIMLHNYILWQIEIETSLNLIGIILSIRALQASSSLFITQFVTQSIKKEKKI